MLGQSFVLSILYLPLKSVQSALTTFGPRGTFSRQSKMRGYISIIQLLQFTIVRAFWASLDKALF